MELVGAGLGDDVDEATAVDTVLGVEPVLDDLELLDRLLPDGEAALAEVQLAELRARRLAELGADVVAERIGLGGERLREGAQALTGARGPADPA